VRIMIVVTYCL